MATQEEIIRRRKYNPRGWSLLEAAKALPGEFNRENYPGGLLGQGVSATVEGARPIRNFLVGTPVAPTPQPVSGSTASLVGPPENLMNVGPPSPVLPPVSDRSAVGQLPASRLLPGQFYARGPGGGMSGQTNAVARIHPADIEAGIDQEYARAHPEQFNWTNDTRLPSTMLLPEEAAQRAETIARTGSLIGPAPRSYADTILSFKRLTGAGLPPAERAQIAQAQVREDVQAGRRTAADLTRAGFQRDVQVAQAQGLSKEQALEQKYNSAMQIAQLNAFKAENVAFQQGASKEEARQAGAEARKETNILNSAQATYQAEMRAALGDPAAMEAASAKYNTALKRYDVALPGGGENNPPQVTQNDADLNKDGLVTADEREYQEVMSAIKSGRYDKDYVRLARLNKRKTELDAVLQLGKTTSSKKA